MDDLKVHVIDRGRKFLYLRYRDPMTGKMIEESSKAATRSEAQKAAGKLEDKLRSGKYKPRSKVTWDEFRKRYEDEVLASLAQGTDAKNSGVLNSVEEILNPGRPADVTTARISHYQRVLRDRGLAEFTIRGHLSVIRSVLRWAVDMEFIPEAPKIKMPDRAKGASMSKGRPVTGEEFDRMLKAVDEVVGPDNAAPWTFLLRGLWWSGLRLGEALNLSWDGDHGLTVHVDDEDVMLRIPGDSQKSGKDQLLPIAPEFVEFLLAVPQVDRTGRVFSLPGNPRQDAVSDIVAAIGEKAGIKVKVNAERPAKPVADGEKRKVRGKSRSTVKYASAHDLRRSFCERWSSRVEAVILMQLARHESIETTMNFYVGRNAKATSKLLREAAEKSDTFGDTRRKSGETCPEGQEAVSS